MTREEINKFLANTKVYVAGKSEEIQKKLFALGYKWNEGGTDVSYTQAPFLYIHEFRRITYGLDMCDFAGYEYREISAEEILTISGYRPFKNSEECWNEMQKHHPFGWLKHKDTQFYMDCRIVTHGGINANPFDEAYYNYTFADGTPFGIKKE